MLETNKWISLTNIHITIIRTSANKEVNKTNETKLYAFMNSKNADLCIISYENYKKYNEIINNIQVNALLVADEGHKLKNREGNQLIDALNKSKCKKRIILTGSM